ncbi:MAG: helix-turn-helix transcriptional regulator, partial [Bacteroidota bacterium]
FYKRKDEALKYLQLSVDINKKQVAQNKLDPAFLVQNYYAFVSTYREIGGLELGKAYLDSCFVYYNDIPGQVDKASLNFERAFILDQQGQTDRALEIMAEIEPWYLENLPSYLVLIYTYWGDMYRNKSETGLSEVYYNKALKISKNYGSHIDFSPLVYERLSDLYLKDGDYQKAYENQKIAKLLDAEFFDSRSENNQPLLEIKDEFRMEKERQEKLIQQQRLEQLEQEDEILLLQRIILIGTIIFILLIGLIYLKQLRAKHKAEKLLIRRNKELEIQKANELLELKNKELAASALQIVEKDEFLKELKTKLRAEGGDLKTSEVNKILRSISISNNNNWEEFKLRFTAVNEKFYNELTSRYPNLSQSDQRICALIKLNFSSKDMARLLGISVESVHTTRYRLRKKIGLERSANLEEFIAAL